MAIITNEKKPNIFAYEYMLAAALVMTVLLLLEAGTQTGARYYIAECRYTARVSRIIGYTPQHARSIHRAQRAKLRWERKRSQKYKKYHTHRTKI